MHGSALPSEHVKVKDSKCDDTRPVKLVTNASPAHATWLAPFHKLDPGSGTGANVCVENCCLALTGDMAVKATAIMLANTVDCILLFICRTETQIACTRNFSLCSCGTKRRGRIILRGWCHEAFVSVTNFFRVTLPRQIPAYHIS